MPAPACGCLKPVFGRRGLVAGLAALSVAAAAPPSESAGQAAAALLDDLVLANRILFDRGVVDAFGHVTARHDRSPERYLLAASMAPSLVTAADIIEFDLDSVPVNAGGRALYVERFIHGEIYRARPDVMAVVHAHPASVIPFASSHVPLRPVSHMAAFLGGGAPVFDIAGTAGPGSDMLVRNADLARALAATLGGHSVVLMRGHGMTVAAQTLRHAVFRAVYTEVNARSQLDALRLGEPAYLSEQEAAAARLTVDGLVERPWALWTRQLGGAR